MDENIECYKCKKESLKSKSRKYKGERYCKKCYKTVSKDERELMGLATGF
jgi:hypothetical protein